MVEYNVAVDIKIFLEDPKIVPKVIAGLGKIAKVRNSSEEDGPFGIRILRATLLLNDEQGGMDEIEEKIRQIEGVSQVEVENVTRV